MEITIIEFGGVIEVAIPKTYYQFKSKKNLFIHLGIEVNKAFKKIKTINEHIIYKTDFKWYEDSTKINDFDYSADNECEPSKTHNVYRFFGFEGLAIEGETIGEIFTVEKGFIIEHKTRYGIIKINIIICHSSKHKKK